MEPVVNGGVVDAAGPGVDRFLNVPPLHRRENLIQRAQPGAGVPGKLEQLGPLPGGQLLPPGHKAAHQLPVWKPVQQPLIGIQVGGGQPVQHHHYVDVAVRPALSPAPAALEPHENQPAFKYTL